MIRNLEEMKADGYYGRVCLVIPCYNEARRLDVEAYRRHLDRKHDHLFIFVDDGSRDHTVQVLQNLANAYPRSVLVLCSGKNRGKAEAVRSGILHALNVFEPEVVGFWDADLATPLDAVHRLTCVLAQRPEIHSVFGARVKLLGRNVKRSPVRHYLGRVFATAVSQLLQLAVYDTQCGAKLFRVSAETGAIFAEPFLSKWVFDVEILARYKRIFHREGQSIRDRIYEYPLESWVDVDGSKVRSKDFLLAFRDVVQIWRRYLR